MNHGKVPNGWWKIITLICKQRHMASNNGTSFRAYEIKRSFCKIDSNDDDDILFLAKVEC